MALAPFCWSICVQKTRSSFQVALYLLAGSKVVRTMIMKIYIFQSRLELSNRQCLCGKTIFLDELNGNKMFSPQDVYLRRRKTCGWRQMRHPLRRHSCRWWVVGLPNPQVVNKGFHQNMHRKHSTARQSAWIEKTKSAPRRKSNVKIWKVKDALLWPLLVSKSRFEMCVECNWFDWFWTNIVNS